VVDDKRTVGEGQDGAYRVLEKKYTQGGIWYHRVQSYGVTQEQFYIILKNQNGCCALCADHLGDLYSRIHIDHDHKTGRVRGLLCARCNNGLGNFRDNADVLRRAADYVTHQNQNLVLPSVGKQIRTPALRSTKKTIQTLDVRMCTNPPGSTG
jgi:hypothetical protein